MQCRYRCDSALCTLFPAMEASLFRYVEPAKVSAGACQYAGDKAVHGSSQHVVSSCLQSTAS